MQSGYIPKSISIYEKPTPEKVGSWKFEFIDNTVSDLNVIPSMVVSDEAPQKTHDTAEKWVQGYSKCNFKKNFCS